MAATNERVPFRQLQCPACMHLLCWVNPRLPSYCPECGQSIIARLKAGEGILETRDAWLRIERPKRDVHESALVACEGAPSECKRPEGECGCMINQEDKAMAKPTIEPHPSLTHIRADEIAECWDGVPEELYSKLWNTIVPLQSAIPNLEDSGPYDHVGHENVASHWHHLTEDEQKLLNELAAKFD